MSINVPFSKRDKQNTIDVYQYDELPKEFREQVVHLIKKTTRVFPYFVVVTYGNRANIRQENWKTLHDQVAEEHGISELGHHRDISERCVYYIRNAETEKVLDLIEYAFKMIERQDPNSYKYTVELLNHRFKEHSLGYQLRDNKIFRVDSEFLHAETVVPALNILSDSKYRTVNEEFRKAHKHYRNGDYEPAIVEAAKAFESLVTIIAYERSWQLPSNATAGPLVDALFDNGLVPSHLDDNRKGVRDLLRGLSVVRNKTSAHGGGVTPVVVPEYMASYCLHMVASNIVFLAELHKNTP